MLCDTGTRVKVGVTMRALVASLCITCILKYFLGRATEHAVHNRVCQWWSMVGYKKLNHPKTRHTWRMEGPYATWQCPHAHSRNYVYLLPALYLIIFKKNALNAFLILNWLLSNSYACSPPGTAVWRATGAAEWKWQGGYLSLSITVFDLK